MRLHPLTSIAAAALCTLSAQALAQSPNPTVVLPGFRGVVRMDTVGTPEVVRGAPAAVFAALQLAYDSLGVETAVRDANRGYIGNLGLKLTRRFAGQAMSRWVDCGTGHTGPTANAYRVNMALLANVTPEPGGNTRLRIAVAAGAQAFSGPLGDPIACESTGAIEQRILEIVRRQVESAPPASPAP